MSLPHAPLGLLLSTWIAKPLGSKGASIWLMAIRPLGLLLRDPVQQRLRNRRWLANEELRAVGN